MSLEFLLSRDIVDKNNIGCIGHSFGGIRCTYLAALNKRIKTVVLSGAVADLKKDTESGVTHTWLSILPNIGRLAGTSEILALIAPRPLMIITGRLDPIYPIDEVEGHLTRLTSLYERLEKKENFEAKIMIKRGHEFPKEFHEIAYQFFDKHLKNN
ncbi:prolyl oligopeptidase family serine peptidase [Candidatus Woesearchaeota archaeon]|nr:prolyl oligopeptidase family serine peptidase [Candidatus Woesearchaeota archaeon]